MSCIGLTVRADAGMVKRYGQSYLDGVRAEQLFRITMETHAPETAVIDATVADNRRKHIDLWVGADAVDVKSRKRISRTNEGRLDDGVWVELAGRSGPGWLFGSQAHTIAFEVDDASDSSAVVNVRVPSDHVLARFQTKFLCADRESLAAWIQGLNLEERCSVAANAWYKVYSRDTDRVTIVGVKDLIANVKHRCVVSSST